MKEDESIDLTDLVVARNALNLMKTLYLKDDDLEKIRDECIKGMCIITDKLFEGITIER